MSAKINEDGPCRCSGCFGSNIIRFLFFFPLFFFHAKCCREHAFTYSHCVQSNAFTNKPTSVSSCLNVSHNIICYFTTRQTTWLTCDMYIYGSCTKMYGKCPKYLNTKISKKMAYANSADPDQTAPEGAV